MVAHTFARVLATGLALLTLASGRVQGLEYEDVLLPELEPWGERAVLTPFVMYDPDYNGGGYRMWYHAANDPYIPYSLDWIAHAYSNDGVNWTKTGPIGGHDAEFGGGKFPGYNVTGRPVILKSGSYHMYHSHYYPWHAYVYLMDSADGVSWSNDREVMPYMPEALPGSNPSRVLREDGGFTMYYDARLDSEWRSAIFRAESVDGEDWTSVQEVLGSGESWEHSVLYADVVRRQDGSYMMYYAAAGASDFPIYPPYDHIGMAKSADGRNWGDRTSLFSISDLAEQVMGVSQPRYLVDASGDEWLYFSCMLDWDGDGYEDEWRIARTRLPVGCQQDIECDDGVFCNGIEACADGSCQPGSDPCPGELCDEVTGTCTDCSIVFQDDFTGTTIDTDKWDVSVVMHYDPETPAPQYGSYGQDDALWFRVGQQNIARGQAITKRTFGEEDNIVEVEVWQDEVSGWQDWPIGLDTHLGSFGYYNYGWHWTVQWLDSHGEQQLMYGFPLPPVTPWTKYKMKIQLDEGLLSWHLDLDDGEGYRLLHSTGDFSVPFTPPWMEPDRFERVVLLSTDIGITFYDNVVVSRCAPCLDDADCDDGLFCNSLETCVDGSCEPGADPCPGQLCDETIEECVECLAGRDCDDALFCNGVETCTEGICEPGTDPCPGQTCDEARDACVSCPTGAAQDIVFVSDRTGNKEVWRMDADGEELIQLTFNPGLDAEPVPSPDGQWIAYVSDAGNAPPAPGGCPKTDIWVVRADGREARRLTFYETAYTHQPAWSPDGLKLAFVRECEGRHLGEVPVDLSEPACDLAGEVARYDPEYCSTGTHLLYTKDNSGAGWWDIWRMEIGAGPCENRGEERLTHWSHSLGGACSHDGNRIAYVRALRSVSQVRLMNSDGSGDTLVWDNSAIAYDGWGQATWSPDDSRVAVSVYPSLYPGVPEFDSFVQVLDAVTGDEIYRTSNGSNTFALESSFYGDRHFVGANMVWNSDGSKLVFMSDRDRNWEVYSMNADGTGHVNLTNTDSWDGDPVWIPCGGCQADADCDDGVGCTEDLCDEMSDSCENVTDNSRCTNDLFCDGAEWCDTALGCQPGSDPCPGRFCDETDDVCVYCLTDVQCDDTLFCNGRELCEEGVCAAGTHPCRGETPFCNELDDICCGCEGCGEECEVYAIFEPPITNDKFVLRDGSTVPIKFHLVDGEGIPFTEERSVDLEVIGPAPDGLPASYVFDLSDGTLRYDDAEDPPHYVTNFSTRRYPVMDGGEYVAIVYENGLPIGSIGFVVAAAPGSGQGNGVPNAEDSADAGVPVDASGYANGDLDGSGPAQAMARPPNLGCGVFSPAVILMTLFGTHFMRDRRLPSGPGP